MVDHVYRLKEIIINMAYRFKFDLLYMQAWKAKNWALQAL